MQMLAVNRKVREVLKKSVTPASGPTPPHPRVMKKRPENTLPRIQEIVFPFPT